MFLMKIELGSLKSKLKFLEWEPNTIPQCPCKPGWQQLEKVLEVTGNSSGMGRLSQWIIGFGADLESDAGECPEWVL